MPSFFKIFRCGPSTIDDGPGGKPVEKPKDVPDLSEEVAQLKKENADLQIRLENEKKRGDESRQAAEKRAADAEGQLKRSRQDVERHQAQAKSEKQKADAFEENMKRLGITLEQERIANQKHNEERDVLLESLKAFLDTHDDVDASTLGSHLANVNDLVEQLASDLLFRWENPPRKAIIDPKGEMPQRVKGIIGSDVVHALIGCNMNDNGSPSLLQYSLQAVLVARVSELFHARTFSSGDHKLIGTLSRKIREDEIQPVYGRWRSVTQRYLRVTSPKNAESTAAAYFAQGAAIDICDVARLFGYEVTEAPSYIQAEFEQSLSDIAKKTIKLANVVTADIITKDYELFGPRGGFFDPESMGTPFNLSRNQKDDKVFCTVSLGLISIGKPGRQQVPPEERVFRPAQVFTKATLDEIVHPPSNH